VLSEIFSLLPLGDLCSHSMGWKRRIELTSISPALHGKNYIRLSAHYSVDSSSSCTKLTSQTSR